MSEFEQNGFRGLWLPGRRLDGSYGVAVIAKRRFRVDMGAGACVPDDATPEFVMASEYRVPDAPMSSSVSRASEIALHKPLVDIIVKGDAHAPGGKPVRTFDVRVRVAEVLDRTLRIIGPRTVKWVAPKKKLTKKQREKGEQQPFPAPTFSRAKAIATLPLAYEYAYGGSGALILEPHLEEVAAKLQEEAQAVEERREKKREIEAQLKAVEAQAAAEVEAAKEAEAGGLAAVGDTGARAKFEAAFKETEGGERDGIKVLDGEERARLEAMEADAMVEASPMRLSDNASEATRDSAEAAEPDEEPEVVEEAPAKTGTAVIDISEMEDADELKGALDAQDAERRRQLRDAEGTFISRTEGMDEVALGDDSWIDEAQKQPEPAGEGGEEESPYPLIPNLANPAGRGYCVSPLEDAVQGVALPCVEYPDSPLTPADFVCDLAEQSLTDIEASAGFDAYGAGWYPRARLAGVMAWDMAAAEEGKAAAVSAFDADDPDDAAAIQAIEEMEIPVMQAGWFQEAHPDMQVDALKGDEEIFLENFSPVGPIFFRLPGTHPVASVDLGEGPRPVLMRIDTVTIDVEAHDAPVVTVVWRGWHPLAGLDAFARTSGVDVHLGEVDQAGWHDAMRQSATSDQAGADGEKLTEDVDEGADDAYREDVHLRKRTAQDGVGVPKDDGGTAIIDIGGERELSDDSFFDKVQTDKEEFEAEAAAKADAARARKDKALKKKAGKMADEELGIDRDEDEE